MEEEIVLMAKIISENRDNTIIDAAADVNDQINKGKLKGKRFLDGAKLAINRPESPIYLI